MTEVVGRALERKGHVVRTASDGTDALQRLEEEPADLVFTDHQMAPMDGMTLLSEVRERYPSIRVVMMTAYGEVTHRGQITGSAAFFDSDLSRPSPSSLYSTRIVK